MPKAKKKYSLRNYSEKVQSNWTKTTGLFNRGEFSLAIIRAATTLELCYNAALEEKIMNNLKMERVLFEAILKLANGLRAKHEKIFMPLFSDNDLKSDKKLLATLISNINENRNKIVHRGEFRKEKTAEKLLTDSYNAIKLIEKISIMDFKIQPIKFD